MGGKRRLPGWGAVSAAAVFHVALLGVLSRQIGGLEPSTASEPMNVSLVRAPPPRSSSAERVAPRRAVSARSLAVPPMRGETTAPQAVPPAPAGVNSAGFETARQVLQELSKCRDENLARLPPEERDRCVERARARDADAGAPRLNLDPAGRYAENPEPYLNRRPTNGCKPRAAGDVGPFGPQGARAGVGCGFSF